MNRDYDYNERGGRMGQGNPQQWEEQSSTRGPNFGQGYGPAPYGRSTERGYGEQSYRGREDWGESRRPSTYGERDFESQMWRGQGPRDQQGYRTDGEQERQGYRGGAGYDPSRGEPWLRYGRGEEYGSDYPQSRGYGGYGPQTRGYGGFDRPGFGGKEMEPGGVYGESWGRQGQYSQQYGQQGQYGSQGMYGQQFGQQGRFSGKGPRGYQKSDDRIRDEVCERLTQAGEIDASEIDIEVRQGEVFLRGTVEDRQQKRMAEDCAESVSGVKDVRNELRVQSQMQQTGGQATSHTPETQRTTATAGTTGTTGQTRNETPARTR